jgi:hypothetical protein
MQTEYSAATVAAAKDAVKTVFSFRFDLGDSGTLEVFLEELRYIFREAKAAGVKISGADWVYLADLANNVCDDDGLPRLFIAEGADA